MSLTLILIVLLGIALMILERIFPDQTLAPVPGWWMRVIIINVLQLGVVILGGYTWNTWFAEFSVLHTDKYLSLPLQAICGYIVITFVYYWWHRIRHENMFLWNTCHQLHHSPSRIETITSFYKHPLELIVNGILISSIIYGLLGVTTEAGAWITFITAAAEYFYHMNIKTPHWIGYVLQRPEMHRIHHERGKHYSNFSDLPVWDMLFGTYQNPPTVNTPCGFVTERELRLTDMLLCKNVNKRPRDHAPR